MKQLLNSIQELKNSSQKQVIDSKIKEFEKFQEKSINEIFPELCFCILAANFNAERSLKIQNELGKQFSTLPEKKLAKKLKELGYRFPNTRANYVVEARKIKNLLKSSLKEFQNEEDLREWLVENVKGLGLKEGSHFLRNIGFKNLAIIDFHIIDLLEKHGLIKKPKTLSKKKYFEIEEKLKTIAKKAKLNLAELDLYLWFLETGKILK